MFWSIQQLEVQFRYKFCQRRKYGIIFIYHQTLARYQISLTKISRSWTLLLITVKLKLLVIWILLSLSIRDRYSIVQMNKTYKYTFRKKKKYSRVSRNSYIWFNHIQKIVYAPYAIFFFLSGQQTQTGLSKKWISK